MAYESLGDKLTRLALLIGGLIIFILGIDGVMTIDPIYIVFCMLGFAMIIVGV